MSDRSSCCSSHLFASVYFDSCLEIHNNIMRYELRNFESVNIYLEGEVYKVRIETVATRSSSSIPLLVFDTFMFRIHARGNNCNTNLSNI